MQVTKAAKLGLTRALTRFDSRSDNSTRLWTRCASTTTTSPTRDIAVLGGGITGLATAYYLAQKHRDAKITVYESKPHLGGWISTEEVDLGDGHVLFEAGPRTLRPAGNGSLTASLVHELGLHNDTIFTSKTSPAALNRYLYYPDRLVKLPSPSSGLLGILSTLRTEPAFEGLLGNLFADAVYKHEKIVRDDESVGDFFSRRLGRGVVDRMLSAVLHGIYAGDVWQLSAKSLFPTLWKTLQEHNSVITGQIAGLTGGQYVKRREVAFLTDMRAKYQSMSEGLLQDFGNCSVFTFRRGLDQLTRALVTRLRDSSPNVTFCNNSSIRAIACNASDCLQLGLVQDGNPRRVEHTDVISSLSPYHLGQTVADRTLGENLKSLPAVTVMTVNMYFRTPDLNPPGFGYLIPAAVPIEENPNSALGVIFDNSYSPAANSPGAEVYQDTVRERGTKLTVMLGGYYWDGWSSFPDEQEAIAMARGVLQQHLGITEEPIAVAVNLQKDCIPQYKVGHEQRLKNIHKGLLSAYNGKLQVAGSWINGVGVNDCLRNAYDVAQGMNADTEPMTGLEAVVEDDAWCRMR